MQLTIDSGRAVLNSKPNPKVMNVARALEGSRKWLKGGGMSLEPSRKNIETLRAAFPDLSVVDLREMRDLAPAREPFTYTSKTEPMPHQKEANAKARTQKAFALFMEQGTGKTLTAITRAGELYAAGNIDAVLVIAKKGPHAQWLRSEVPDHLGVDWGGEIFTSGRKPEPAGDPTGGLRWGTINFDALKFKGGREWAEAFVNAHKGRIFIIADETQEICNTQSARFKAVEEIKKLARSPFRMILTGTPIPKDLTDEWAQLKWLNEEILGMRYISSFRNEFCIMGGFEGKEILAHKNVERFREMVEPYMFRVTKEDLGMLPPVFRRWRFPLLPAQKQAMAELRQSFRAMLESGEEVNVTTAATALMRAQQISNGFITNDEKEVVDLVPREKNPRLLALLEVLEDRPGKTIIWARFRRDIALIEETLAADGRTFVAYHGGTSEPQRKAAVESFLDPDGATYFVANAAAAGTGLNLQGGCRHAVFYSNSFNSVERWQSEARIHRIGMNGLITYTDLVAKGSIDAKILGNLRAKKNIAALAFGEIEGMLLDDEG